MKKIIICALLFIAVQTLFSQSNATLARQGYAVGCNLAKAYANGSATSQRVYISTISAAHYPQAYKSGVINGFSSCYKPKRNKRSYGGSNGVDNSTINGKTEAQVIREALEKGFTGREKKQQ